MSINYRSVGINAPTLDNSDECKILINEGLLYASIDSADNTESTNLVLYKKLTEQGCYSLLDSPDISRNKFNTGAWGLPINGIDQPWAGGDYYIIGATHIKAELFKTGKLNQLRFKFFTKDSYNTDNPQLIIPNISNEELSKDEIWHYLNDTVTNKGVVTKVAFLIPNIIDNVQNGWKMGSLAKLDIDNLPHSNDDWFIYTLEEDFYITADMMANQNYSFAIVFFPNADNWISADNKSLSEKFNKSATYSPQNLRNIIGNNDANGNNDRTVAMRSIPRGSLDGTSYVYAPTTDTNSGTLNGQNRLLEIEYCINTDLITEYLTDNSEKHHLDIKDVQELNTLRYSTPLIPDKEDSLWTVKKTGVKSVYISHNSLSRNGKIDIKDKQITSIRIPFNLGSDEDYLVSSENANNAGMLKNIMLNRNGGLCHTNRKLYIQLNGDDSPKIESTNYIAYSYFNEQMIYEWFFESENPEDLKYNNKGIIITAGPPKRANGTFEAGEKNFAVNIFKNGENYYAYSSADRINSTNGGYININATPEIKIIFNYIQRGDWFDYIENMIARLEKRIDNNIINSSSNSISIGKWHLRTNSDEDLVIETDKMRSAGKSIVFKETI